MNIGLEPPYRRDDWRNEEPPRWLMWLLRWLARLWS